MTMEKLQAIAIVIGVMAGAVTVLSGSLEFVARRAANPRTARAFAAATALTCFGLIAYCLRPGYLATPVLNGVKVAFLAVGVTQMGPLVAGKKKSRSAV